MKLKCGCVAQVGQTIMVANKLTTILSPKAIICYKAYKAKIISLEPFPGFIKGMTVEGPEGLGNALLDAWCCECSCAAHRKWLETNNLS